MKESIFKFNRFYLLFALCFSLIIPFLPGPSGFQISGNLVPEALWEPVILLEKGKQKEPMPIQGVGDRQVTEFSPEAPVEKNKATLTDH